MDSDDDFQSFPPQEESSPQTQHRRLKRLKKPNPNATEKNPLSEPIDGPLLTSSVDFARLEALEDGSGALDFKNSNSSDDPFLCQESGSKGDSNENEDEGKDNLENGSEAVVKKTKRVLDFGMDDVKDIGECSIDIERGKFGKEQAVDDGSFEKNVREKKNKRRKSEINEEPVNKRRQEKERKAYLKELHAESQRLLRESRDAAFKLMPVTKKPLSSILEKIRKRKIELSKKYGSLNYQTCVSEDCSLSIDKMNASIANRHEMGIMEKDMVQSGVDAHGNSNPPKLGECDDTVRSTSSENVNLVPLNEEEPMLPFQAPLQDTEDLFDDSQTNVSADERVPEKQSSPLEKESDPSLLDIDLKFDSVSMDDSCSDEEDNDKENLDPHHVIPGGSSPKNDPIKNFVDDEAEEEDDSDNDPDHFRENEEDEDVGNYEELKDMIATGYEEKPIDNEKRNRLHQQWLEQQDAIGTDNILQRLKCEPEIRETIVSDEKSGSDEDDEEFEEAQERIIPRNPARVTTRKAKQVMLELFTDKDDAYLSDNDEDSYWRNAKQHLTRNEEKGILVSPADDENYREVFGLTKKLDIVTGNKKKLKSSSFFDTVLKGGNTNSVSKSSFLGRVANHPISSSNKQGSGIFRSFVFGRDDNNSRSSIILSEDSSDSVCREIQPTRIFAAKVSSSLTKFSCENTEAAASTTSASLFEILKRSSSQSHVVNQDTTVDLTKSILALRVSKKAMKIQGRS